MQGYKEAGGSSDIDSEQLRSSQGRAPEGPVGGLAPSSFSQSVCALEAVATMEALDEPINELPNKRKEAPVVSSRHLKHAMQWGEI